MYKLEDVLTEKQIYHVVKKYVAEAQWRVVDSVVKPAADGLAGFLGDHLKVALHVKVGDWVKTIQVFIKRIPLENKPKADFIDEHNFYRREMVMYQLLDEICLEKDPNPWCLKALLCTESILVLPDVNVVGYSARPHNQTFDLAHVLVSTAAVARFHAAFANYETRKPNFQQRHENIMSEATFLASPWLRASAKLSAKLLDAFSTKYYQTIPELEDRLFKNYIEGCNSLKEYEDTLNVVVHKDLWVNNLMFRYENGLPANAVIIDYQCIRYAPPAFDLMGFLYLTTSRSFREQHEEKVKHYYYCVFYDSLDEAAKARIKELGVDRENFLEWCERARLFSMCLAISIFPYILMDPKIAQKTFDDPATYDKLTFEDRSGPVIAHAKECKIYKHRQLEVTEELVERYILKEA